MMMKKDFCVICLGFCRAIGRVLVTCIEVGSGARRLSKLSLV